MLFLFLFFFFKQKTAYEMRISDWSSDVCSSDLLYYGDPTRPDLLRAAGGERIEVFVMTMDDPDTNTKAVRLVRRMYPDAKVFARARDRRHAWRLMDLGATVFRELFGSSLTMGEEVLVALGMPPEQAADHAARYRKSTRLNSSH